MDHESIRAAPELRERRRDASRITHGNRLHRQIQPLLQRRKRLEKAPEPLPGHGSWVVEENHPSYCGDGVLEQLNALGVSYLKLETGHVPTGPREAPYYPLFHGCAGNRKYDRDGRGRLFRGHRGWCATRDDHVDTRPHQAGCEFGQSVLMEPGKAGLHDEASTLDIPKVMEALEETGLEETLDPRRIGSEDPDLVYLARLLRLGGEWRGEKAARQTAQKCAPKHYWITSSARPSSDGGIVSPSALAV